MGIENINESFELDHGDTDSYLAEWILFNLLLDGELATSKEEYIAACHERASLGLPTPFEEWKKTDLKKE